MRPVAVHIERLMVVKNAIRIGLVVLFLAACNSEPPITSGKVMEKRFTPAHWEDGYRTESRYGPHCGYDIYGDYDCSIKHYTEQVYEAHHYYVNDRFQLQLESCGNNDKGELKCRTGWITIPESEYSDYAVGVNYPSPR